MTMRPIHRGILPDLINDFISTFFVIRFMTAGCKEISARINRIMTTTRPT
jgi:hypothetical protein